MSTQVFAFARVPDKEARQKVYQSVKEGKSRFGMWNQAESLREKYHGANGFLLRIHKGDWIVHVNNPSYGKCIAVQSTGEYEFDDGLECDWGEDFNNYIPVDPSTIIEFERNNPNVIPSVNLAPMRRGQRVLQVKDFLTSIENLRANRFNKDNNKLKGLAHLRIKMEELLPEITMKIHQMNRNKDFENFLHKIFDGMPNTLSIQNGYGWRSDNGADLIVEFQNPIMGVNLSSKLVVQAKSYEGNHFDLKAVDQIVTGIKEYNADGGLLITTAQSTEQLEEYIQTKSDEIDKCIDLISGSDVARFVIRYAPELLIGSESIIPPALGQ